MRMMQIVRLTSSGNRVSVARKKETHHGIVEGICHVFAVPHFRGSP